MHTILVTGGAGFIGSNFINHVFASNKYHIVNFDAMYYCADELNVFYAYPHLIFTECILHNNLIIDSDVHRDFVSLKKNINYEQYPECLKKNNKWNIQKRYIANRNGWTMPDKYKQHE